MCSYTNGFLAYLRLQGVNAKEHPVFKELTRVKQYFEKIKTVETVPEKRTTAVDKEAAGRFIKHGLVRSPISLYDHYLTIPFNDPSSHHRLETTNMIWSGQKERQRKKPWRY